MVLHASSHLPLTHIWVVCGTAAAEHGSCAHSTSTARSGASKYTALEALPASFLLLVYYASSFSSFSLSQPCLKSL